MLTKKPATRDDWSISPMPDEAAERLDWSRRFSTEEYRLLKLGYIPDTYGDDWFAFFEQETFFIHWKHSGQCVCSFQIAVDAGEYQLVDAMVNRSALPGLFSNIDQTTSLMDGFLSNLLRWIERTEKPAKRTDWPNILSMPDQKTQLDVNIVITGTRYEKLRWGYIPRAMEDHWFYFWEANCLYLHQSWTGYCIFQIKFEPDDKKYKAVEIWANRDPDQYNHDDEFDQNWLLNFF